MRVLLTGIPSILERDLSGELSRHHTVVTLDGDVRDRAVCAAAADCDVIVHGLADGLDPLTSLDHASRGTWNLLTTTRARRYVFLSSMRMFDAYDSAWNVTETWSPRPSTDVSELAPYLAEVAAREISRSRPIDCLMVRLDDVVSGDRFASEAVQPQWLHVNDAVKAISRAVTIERASENGSRWVPLHIVRGGPGSRFPAGKAAAEPFGFSADHRTTDQRSSPITAPRFPRSLAPLADLTAPERVVVFGAGGPLGAVTTAFLKDYHQLRLTDIRPLGELGQRPPQSPGAPLPVSAEAPHEEFVVDVTDQDAVDFAARDMDAIVNCTVVRPDPVQAFRVNTLGAFNVMTAAVAHGIGRVVHTGPILTLAPHPAGYTDDRDVGPDVPARPGDNLYFVSKFLGQEICRIFAEQHGIACPTLLFCVFVNPAVEKNTGGATNPFAISWDDSGRAMAAAVRVPQLPAPFVTLHILADAPHDRYRSDLARTVLGWQPQDRLDQFWQRQ
ncbi:MAG: NAD-dependent epimerase/dehydratase family protein [Thermomicrobiales bacterium]|nr:NAD-dependent epimerase/dehydratase family protein [Thermomicrobiales bacterium]